MTALALGGGSFPDLAEAQSGRHEIQGTVVDESGRPVDGLRVAAHPEGGTPGEGQGTSTATGSFRFDLLAGVYRLEIHSDRYGVCRVSGMENTEKRLNVIFVAEPDTASHIDIVVGRSAPAGGGWVPCYFNNAFHTVEGTVLGPDQEPLEGTDVRLWRRSNGHYSGPWTGESTGPDGTFAVEVPRGSYRLELTTWVGGGGECRLGYFGPDGKRAPAGAVTELSVETGDIGGIAITLTEPASELCREVQGVVTDAKGNPLARVWLSFFGHGEGVTFIADEAGAFRGHLRDGSYRVTIWTDRGGDCTLVGYRGPAPTKGGSFVVDGDGVSGLRFVLSGVPWEVQRHVPCPYIEMISTELEPGWNLAGWTGPPTAVSSVFNATPQLEAIYAWNTDTRSFRGALRQGSGSRSSLDTLEPGMGLWLFIEGAERVNWTRPFVAESALVSLADGWNLVGWGGRDGVTADVIFNSLGAEPVVAATWDASRGAFLSASTAAPAGAQRESQVGRGDALWLQTSEKERWLQPGWPAPDVVLLGGNPTGMEDWYRRDVEEAQVFFAERYGVITSDVTFYFASDQETLEDAYRAVRGFNPAANLCADYDMEAIFVATYRCFPVVHEYFHSIQDALSGGTFLRSPTWIVEGSALYTDFQHRYSKGQASYLPGQRFTWATLGPELTLGTGASLDYEDSSLLGYLAFEWLAEEVGEGALIHYFALLKTSATWEGAFRRAFGLTLDDFYAGFEEHRREVAPPFEWSVSGRILDHNARPVEGIDVWVMARVGEQLSSNYLTPTKADGSFAIENAPGSGYFLLLSHTCPSGDFHDVGGYGQGGFTLDARNAPPFTGEDRDRTGLTITLPVTLAELEGEYCAPWRGSAPR